MKSLLLLGLLFTSLHADVTPQTAIPLYPSGASDAKGTTDKDTPTLTAYLPEKSDKPTSAILICPGGAYGALDRKSVV
jgi:hypothetical protein